MKSRFHAAVYVGFMLCALGATLACGSSVGRGAQRAAADVLLPVPEENKLGTQMEGELATQLKEHPDAEVQKYIQSVGQRIVAVAKDDIPEGIEFKFTVIDDPNTVNAFAIPGGHIYFYSGLMLLADNESEIYSVMGHEVSHVTQRHVARRLVAQFGLQAVLAMALGNNPGLLSQIIAGVAGNGYLLKYGRDQEREADKFGMKYEIAAGYDPHGFVTFFDKLNKVAGGGIAILSSHPLPAERVETAKARIAEYGQVPTKTGAAEYQSILARLKASLPPANAAK